MSEYKVTKPGMLIKVGGRNEAIGSVEDGVVDRGVVVVVRGLGAKGPTNDNGEGVWNGLGIPLSRSGPGHC